MANKLKKIAQKFVSSDQLFQQKLHEAISNKRLKETLLLCSNKALWWQKNKGGLNDIETMELAFEIFMFVFKDFKLPEDVKYNMSQTVWRKLIELGKRRMRERLQAESLKDLSSSGSSEPESEESKDYGAEEIKSRGISYDTEEGIGSKQEIPQQPVAEKMGVKPPRPKIFSSSLTAPAASVEPKTQKPSSLEMSEEERLKLERERIRRKMLEENKTRQVAPGAKAKSDLVAKKVKEWLQSDSDFWDLLERVKVLPNNNSMMLYLDPDGDTVIKEIELRFAGRLYQNHLVTRIKASAYSGTKYPYNMAIAKVKGGVLGQDWVAYSFPDEIPEDVREALLEMSKVDFRNQLDWDRLMVIINNDKFLKRSLKKLQIKNPAPGSVEKIAIPIIIKKDVPTSKIIVESYLSLKMKPWTIFIDVMDQIAEDLYVLRAEDATAVSSSLSSKFEALSTQPKDMRGYKFHFIESDASVTVKTCPHCGKPFPNPNADYRRCPHCLAKLK